MVVGTGEGVWGAGVSFTSTDLVVRRGWVELDLTGPLGKGSWGLECEEGSREWGRPRPALSKARLCDKLAM